MMKEMIFNMTIIVIDVGSFFKSRKKTKIVGPQLGFSM